MMPDDRRRTKRDHKTSLLEPPAKIDVIPGFTIFGVEAANALKDLINRARGGGGAAPPKEGGAAPQPPPPANRNQ